MGGAGSLPRPPISPREVQGRLLPLSPLDGEERGLLPPRTPCRKAGVSSAPVPSTLTPRVHLHPWSRLAAGERGQSSLALGGGWETSALTPGPAGQGAPPRARVASPPPLYPVTGAGGRQPSQRPASSVLHSSCSGPGLARCPGNFFSSVWDRRCSQHPGPQVSLSPGPLGSPRRHPLLEARSRLGVRGQPGPLGPMCVSGRGRGPAGGAFKYGPSPPCSGVGLPPRWSWCSDAGSVIKTVQLLSCGFWPLAVGKPAGPW